MKIFLLLFICLATFNSLLAQSQMRVEVASLFLENDQSNEYKNDVDGNIIELSQNVIDDNFNISIYRELESKEYIYRPDIKSSSKKEITFNSLLHNKIFPANVTIPGTLQVFSSDLLRSKNNLSKFLFQSFKEINSLKVLHLYGHGVGATGYDDFEFKKLKYEIETFLKQKNTKIDLIIYDSCFLGNIEFLYEMRNLSRFSIASEESLFSTGQPLKGLDGMIQDLRLKIGSDRREQILFLSKEIISNFLFSYSTVTNGKYSQVVSESSAVIALYDNSKWSQFIKDFKILRNELDNLSELEKNNLLKKIEKLFLDKKTQIDLGVLLNKLATNSKLLSSKKILSALEIDKADFRSLNPSLTLKKPSVGAILEVGINNWSNNAEVLVPILPKSKILSSNKNGIFLSVEKIIRLSPFLPHVKTFNARWIDQKTNKVIGKEFRYERKTDLKFSYSNSFIKFFGFTESQNSIKQKYSGIAITHPFQTFPNLDYLDLEFQQLTNWLK